MVVVPVKVVPGYDVFQKRKKRSGIKYELKIATNVLKAEVDRLLRTKSAKRHTTLYRLHKEGVPGQRKFARQPERERQIAAERARNLELVLKAAKAAAAKRPPRKPGRPTFQKIIYSAPTALDIRASEKARIKFSRAQQEAARGMMGMSAVNEAVASALSVPAKAIRRVELRGGRVLLRPAVRPRRKGEPVLVPTTRLEAPSKRVVPKPLDLTDVQYRKLLQRGLSPLKIAKLTPAQRKYLAGLSTTGFTI